MRWWFSRPLNSFYLLFLKLLTKFEKAFWNPPQRSLHCDWSMFSSLDPSLDVVKMRQNIISHVPFSTILHYYRRLPMHISRVNSVESFLKGFSRKNFWLFQQQGIKQILKTISEFIASIHSMTQTLKNCIYHDQNICTLWTPILKCSGKTWKLKQ
jgi:hypothetical protein